MKRTRIAGRAGMWLERLRGVPARSERLDHASTALPHQLDEVARNVTGQLARHADVARQRYEGVEDQLAALRTDVASLTRTVTTSLGLPPSGPAFLDGPRVLLVAPGGVGNVGDDAITDAVLTSIVDAHPDAMVHVVTDRDAAVVSTRPARWEGALVEVGSRLDLDSFDFAWFAGGGNLASPFRRDHIGPRVALADALARHGVPTVWSGQGIGPCTEDELVLIERAAAHATAFGCRDPLSVEMLTSRRNTDELPGDIVLVGDDAMARPHASRAFAMRQLERAGVPTERFVVFHVRDANYVGDGHLRQLAAAVDHIAAENRACVVGLGVNSNAPREIDTLSELAASDARRAPWRFVDASGSAALASALVGAADVVVAHSYHVGLWALEADTPAVLVANSPYYDAKVEGLARLAGWDPQSIRLDTVDASAISDRLAQVRALLPTSRLARVGADVGTWRRTQLERLSPARTQRR